MKQDQGFQRCEFWQISRCAGRYSDQVWKSTTWFSEEWKISLIAMYTVLGTIKKWQWHGFLHGNLSSLIRIYHKNFERRFFFNGWDIVTRAWGREIASKSVSLTPKAWDITCMMVKFFGGEHQIDVCDGIKADCPSASKHEGCVMAWHLAWKLNAIGKSMEKL